MSTRNTISHKTNDGASGRKVFTVEMAQATLPLVRRIVADIVEQHSALVCIEKSYHETLPDGPSELLDSLRHDRRKAACRLNELTDELEFIGCEVQDFEAGLIGYPSVLDGREIYLCWQPGEATIASWHERYAGLGERQPLTHH